MSTKKLKKPVIVTREEDETAEGLEVLASSIKQVAHAAKVITSGPLKMEAIVLLIQAACDDRINRSAIKSVLTAASQLDVTYLKRGG